MEYKGDLMPAIGPLRKVDLQQFFEFAEQTDSRQIFDLYYKSKAFKDKEDEEGIIVAKDNGKIVGALFVLYREHEAIIFTDCPRVVPEYQGKDVQGSLINYIKDLCEKRGISRIDISISENAQDLISLYTKKGFHCECSKFMMKKKIEQKDTNFETNLTFRSMPELGFDCFVTIVVTSSDNIAGLDASQLEEAWKKDLRKWRQREGYDPSIWVVGYEDDEPVGFVIPRLWEKGKWTETNTGDILEIAVMPKHRRRGYGTSLLRKAVASLAEKGAEEVLLSTDSTDIPALNLYKKVGFRIYERIFSCTLDTSENKEKKDMGF